MFTLKLDPRLAAALSAASPAASSIAKSAENLKPFIDAVTRLGAGFVAPRTVEPTDHHNNFPSVTGDLEAAPAIRHQLTAESTERSDPRRKSKGNHKKSRRHGPIPSKYPFVLANVMLKCVFQVVGEDYLYVLKKSKKSIIAKWLDEIHRLTNGGETAEKTVQNDYWKSLLPERESSLSVDENRSLAGVPSGCILDRPFPALRELLALALGRDLDYWDLVGKKEAVIVDHIKHFCAGLQTRPFVPSDEDVKDFLKRVVPYSSECEDVTITPVGGARSPANYS